MVFCGGTLVTTRSSGQGEVEPVAAPACKLMLGVPRSPALTGGLPGSNRRRARCNLPAMSWTEIGASIGALAGLFTVLDRLAFGRPLCSISTIRPFSIDLECHNPSRYHILITGIRTWPNVVAIAREESVRGMVAAVVGQRFVEVIPPGTSASFPVVVRESAQLKGAQWRPFVIVVSWRKTRSVWLPQIPGVIFSSAKALRMLKTSSGS